MPKKQNFELKKKSWKTWSSPD